MLVFEYKTVVPKPEYLPKKGTFAVQARLGPKTLGLWTPEHRKSFELITFVSCL